MLCVRVEELESRLAPAGNWSAASDMASPRQFHTETLLDNGKVLVAGGSYAQGLGHGLASTELYDSINNSWSSASSMATLRMQHTATLLSNGKVLVAGGQSGTQQGVFLNSAELYDPATNTWSPAGSMTKARIVAEATLLVSGKVLVTGGIGSNNTSVSAAELYDPVSNTWSSAGSMSRIDHTATLLANGSVLVTGGYSGAYPNFTELSSASLYNPASNTWSSAGTMATVRREHAATLLSNGEVLVTGGSIDNTGSLSSTELYDPASNTWSAAGAMATARGYHMATRLGNGEVLVVGGIGSIASAERYDPASDTWTSAGSMAAARGTSVDTATLLSNGKVLVAGGNQDVTLSSAELYDPGNGAGFVVAGFPSTISAGTVGAFTITAQNADGTTNTSYTGTVHLSSSDSQAVLPGDYTFTADDQGVHVFNVALKTAGGRTLSVTDVATGAGGSQIGIGVNPAAASHFALSGPASVNSNASFNITVKALDAYGNVATGYRGAVRFTDSLTGSTLPANYTFKASDNGAHTFTGLKLKTKGNHTITVVDTLDGSILGTWVINV